LDYSNLGDALSIAKKLSSLGTLFKIGSHLFPAAGPQAVREVAALGCGVFLDLKFHDIPSTVSGAMRAVATLPGVRLVNMHALGGAELMRAAAESLRTAIPNGSERPKLLGVTILTSMDEKAIHSVGLSGKLSTHAVRLARLAKKSGLDGVVSSAREAAAIRRACGKNFIILVPGVRPRVPGAKNSRDDQARTATPAEAIRAGADYIVVGRPITAASDPVAAASAVLQEIESALHGRV
jgi:orotidine-5'-phosphate decarboxylase